MDVPKRALALAKVGQSFQTDTFRQSVTPATLRLTGKSNKNLYWLVTSEVLADDVLVRVRPSQVQKPVSVEISSDSPLPTYLNKAAFAALFSASRWHGTLTASGNDGILATIDGLRNGSTVAVTLTFKKKVDDHSWLTLEGPASSFIIRAATLRPQDSGIVRPQGANGSPTAADFLTLVRQRIRNQRILRGYSIQRMASMCDFPKTTLGDLERGSQRITVEHLYKICSGLGINVAELVATQESEIPTKK